jgi:hypothetical protein
MADSSLRASDDAVSVTIPADYFSRFADEALFALGSAADTIQETVGWMQKAMSRDEDPVRELSLEDLENFEARRRVWLQVWDERAVDDMEITGDREALRSAMVGCQLEVADELKGEVEGGTADVRPLADELLFWQELRDGLARGAA